MKPFAAILCVVVALTVTNSHAASLNRVRRQVVPKEFANINIENYLKNDRAVQFQLKCIVYDGPCDRIGKYLKVTIPELLTNQCQNCEPAQRQRAGRLVQHIQQKFPKEWSDAVQKFQGGQVKKEDADKLESLLGVKLDSKLVAEAPSTAAPLSTPAPVVVEVSPAASEVSSTAAPAPVSSSAAPEVSSSAPVASSSEAPVASSSAAPEVSSSAPVALVASSSEAPVVSSSAAPEVTSSAAPVSSSSAAPSTSAPVASSSAAPATPEATSPAAAV